MIAINFVSQIIECRRERKAPVVAATLMLRGREEEGRGGSVHDRIVRDAPRTK
jgi:hypothetical protein